MEGASSHTLPPVSTASCSFPSKPTSSPPSASQGLLCHGSRLSNLHFLLGALGCSITARSRLGWGFPIFVSSQTEFPS